jgi:predicted O-methyltransferase YrrM
VTEHADRLREVMTRAGVDAQTVAEAIGGEALKLRDALDALLLPA